MKANPLAIIAATCALVTASQGATMFGVQFINSVGDSVTLLSSETAGLVPQSNFNPMAGTTGSNVALKDETGATTTTLLTYSARGLFTVNVPNAPASPDEKLNSHIINGTNGTQPTFTVTAIPFTLYDLIVYTLNDNQRLQRITLSGIGSFTVNSPNPSLAGYVDGNVATAYIYTQGTTNSLTPVTNSNYVRFTGLTAASLTITSDARPGTFGNNGQNDNGFINGFQIVQIPEPTSLSLLGICGTLALLRRRRA